MKRALLKQMRYEWRDNIWMILGLAIVALAVWFISVGLLGTARGLFYPLGADTDNVCLISIRTVPKSSPEYIDRGEDSEAAENQDLRSLIGEIRNSQYVEAAAFSDNATPYSMSFMGTSVYIDENDSIGYPVNVRTMSPDMVRVLKIQSLTGKTENELINLLRDGQILISNYVLENKDRRQPEELYGRSVKMGGSSPKRVGDIVRQVRRTDYDLNNSGMVFMSIDESESLRVWEMLVRVKPGMAQKFVEEFESTPSMQRHGNKILYNLEFLSDKAGGVQRKQDTSLRMTICLNILLIIIVALGIMGVFWFRVQQRVGETAIRKVCGATDSDIFRRIITEGLTLLLIAAFIMIAAGWPLMKATLLTSQDVDSALVAIAAICTIAFLALAMVICIWVPARKAMRIEPAIAIKDE